MGKGKKIEKIAPVVVSSPAHEVIVFGLDDDGGLWKWDTGMKTDEWVQVCKPMKGRCSGSPPAAVESSRAGRPRSGRTELRLFRGANDSEGAIQPERRFGGPLPNVDPVGARSPSSPPLTSPAPCVPLAVRLHVPLDTSPGSHV